MALSSLSREPTLPIVTPNIRCVSRIFGLPGTRPPITILLFIPQIPRKLIELLRPEEGEAILDPFCGSGTALVEAQAAGFPAVGIDLNPIAALISQVKTHPPIASVAGAAAEVEMNARRRQA